MLMNMYSVYDKVTQVYGPILLEVNDDSLRRNCKTMIKNEFNNGNKSLEGFIARKSDLVVYKKGTFDTSSGELKSIGEVQVFTVTELVDQVQVEVQSEIDKYNFLRNNIKPGGDCDGSKKE